MYTFSNDINILFLKDGHVGPFELSFCLRNVLHFKLMMKKQSYI